MHDSYKILQQNLSIAIFVEMFSLEVDYVIKKKMMTVNNKFEIHRNSKMHDTDDGVSRKSFIVIFIK